MWVFMLDLSMVAVAERQCVGRCLMKEGRAGRNHSFGEEMALRAASPQSAICGIGALVTLYLQE